MNQPPKRDWRKQFNKSQLGKKRHRPAPEARHGKVVAADTGIHASGLPKLVVDFADTRSQRLRHTWIYDNMIPPGTDTQAFTDGNAVAVVDLSGKFLGSAIYNSHSRIRGRMFSLDAVPFDDAYVSNALKRAIARRRMLFDPNDSCRLIYADSDGLPGLIVDKIGSVLVVQLLTFAIDLHAEHVIRELQQMVTAKGIVIRRDIKVREKEGLQVIAPEIIGEVDSPLSVEQDGFIVFADLLGGQKTGLFLDQRFNRRLIKPWCKDARVLDLYCYVGAWSFTAALAGAREVLAIDSSSSATQLATRGAAKNRFENIQLVTMDVFEFFDEHKGKEYDLIVCDPPAFAKTRAHVREALKGYLSLNYRCMKALPVGGILATSSCSQHVGTDEFETMLENAARNARMRFQVVVRASQAADHPPLLGFPESEYLKCFILQRTE